MDEEEEDVVIEGSELHRVLAGMGYTDCELTLANKNDNVLRMESTRRRYRGIEILRNFFENWHPLESIFRYAPKIHVSSKQFRTIMRAESLLDDHAAIVGSFLEKNSPGFSKYGWNLRVLITISIIIIIFAPIKFTDWTGHLIYSAMIVIAYSMFKRKKTLATLIPLSIAAFAANCKYKEFQAVSGLQDLVAVQNELYRSYKKSLGVLRNVYRIRVDGKKPSAKFSKLEADRLKYLQPFTESLLKSMEKVSVTYYRASSMIVDRLPKSSLENYPLTRFEADAFALEGEITYEKVRKHLYYVYVLVQSDTMQLLAIAYDTWRKHERVSQSLLRRIVGKLCLSLKNEKYRMTNVTGEFENCKRKTIEREFRLASATKWRDLYLNLELMSRRLQIVYDEINSILGSIEKRENNETSEEAFVTELAARTQDLYSQIDKSRNFAEFNNLLIAALRRSGKVANGSISNIDSAPIEAEGDREIVRDREPEIIDEVFEEYITEEYLRPLYEESDEATIDIAKFDKLLAKNFMCELKEALVDKYKSMSEREAKALLRRHRDTGKPENSENNRSESVDSNIDPEKSIIPQPPPLPGFVRTSEDSAAIPPPRRKPPDRRPVPLPRAKNHRLISHRHATGRSRASVPPPPPPPLPPTLPPTEVEPAENTERFPIGLPDLADRKMPAFVTFTEEFIGSGENSEEELGEHDEDMN